MRNGVGLGAAQGGEKGFHRDPEVAREGLDALGGSLATPQEDVADMAPAVLGASRDHAESRKFAFRADEFAQYTLCTGGHGASLLHGDRV